LFDSLRRVPSGAAKLRSLLSIVDGKEKVSRLVSCDFWGDFEVCRIVTLAIAEFLQKAWSLRNKCKHGGDDQSASEVQGRGVDGNIAMA
jgi:hypothetical protein